MSKVKIGSITGIALLIAASLGFFFMQSKVRSNLPLTHDGAILESGVNGELTTIDETTRGIANDDPRGYMFDPNLIDFMDKLNGVNLFVFENAVTFESAEDIDNIYRNLWLYGESLGFRITAILTQEAYEVGISEYTPQAATFVNIKTIDNINYCAVDEAFINPEYDTNQALQQALLFYSCEEYLTEYNKIIEAEVSEQNQLVTK